LIWFKNNPGTAIQIYSKKKMTASPNGQTEVETPKIESWSVFLKLAGWFSIFWPMFFQSWSMLPKIGINRDQESFLSRANGAPGRGSSVNERRYASKNSNLYPINFLKQRYAPSISAKWHIRALCVVVVLKSAAGFVVGAIGNGLSRGDRTQHW
jgi:hypothetical protein